MKYPLIGLSPRILAWQNMISTTTIITVKAKQIKIVRQLYFCWIILLLPISRMIKTTIYVKTTPVRKEVCAYFTASTV